MRSHAQTKTTSKRPRRASDIIASSPGRLAFTPLIRFGVLLHDLEAALGSHLAQVKQLRLGVLVDG
jgi:hypothetical protein